jgi:8-oxo-dGTP pyrophosphatase MutT (NUDIX family)
VSGAGSEPAPRRIRRAARILLFDPANRLLLFRFSPSWADPFWALPGGECDPGEAFADAARRELFEETGIEAIPEPLHHIREEEFTTLLGEPVSALEHYFQCRTELVAIDTGGHTDLERAIMCEHRWFAPAELASWPETIFPAQLDEIIVLAREKTTEQEGLRE